MSHEQGTVGSIDVEHLWKRFRADRAPRALRDRLPTLARRRNDADAYRWVLRDIELSLDPGDAVGLIGSNGSGKSTLLKILTGVMYPYAGRYQVNGRVGALLEVRAGLHGDLTGRENIYLYGGLLGLTRSQVAERFDDIVEFAVLEQAIDRQVKFYSSGMGMRLGFSVAAFLEPDVLLVDEALAVGDAFFQQRCLDRMTELLVNGTTLVLVSHDLAAVESVCRRGIWLNDGVKVSDDDVRTTLTAYRTWVEDAYHSWVDETSTEAVFRQGSIEIVKAETTDVGGGLPRSHGTMLVDVALDVPSSLEGTLCLGITEGTASPVFIVNRECTLEAGRNSLTCEVAHLPLAAGRYYVWLQFTGHDGTHHLPWQPTGGPFLVEGQALSQTPIGVKRSSPVEVDGAWRVTGQP